MTTYSRREFLALFFPSGRTSRLIARVARLSAYIAIIVGCAALAFSVPTEGWQMIAKLVLKYGVPAILLLWFASAGHEFLKRRGFTTALRIIDVAREIVTILAWMAVGAMLYARWAHDRYDALITAGVLFAAMVADRLRNKGKDGEQGDPL